MVGNRSFSDDRTRIRLEARGANKFHGAASDDDDSPMVGQERSEGLLLTYGTVQRKLREVGIVMSKPNGSYRINFFGGQPSTEQFTDKLEAALEAGLKLASTRKGPAW